MTSMQWAIVLLTGALAGGLMIGALAGIFLDRRAHQMRPLTRGHTRMFLVSLFGLAAAGVMYYLWNKK